MAFKDGMAAISKTLKVIAIGGSGFLVTVGVWSCFSSVDQSSHNAVAAFMCAGILYFLFWTPAWIINKFIQ